MLTTGCSKDRILSEPPPSAPNPVSVKIPAAQLAIELPANSNLQNAQATLVLEKAGEEKIVKVQLKEQNNKMHTGAIVLNAGEYQLVQLKITDKQGTYVYAVPQAQSAKANEVATPLAVKVAVANDTPLVNLSVAAITAGSNAADFGYPQNAFEGQDQFTIKLNATINIGGCIYAGIDGQLLVTWYDGQNREHTEQVQLQPGDNTLFLAKSATRFVFEYKKWNVTDKMEMPASSIEPGMTIAIGGSVAARKLAEEQTWNESNGTSQLYSRKTYQYNAGDQLVKTMYYQKIPQHQEPQLQQVHEFEYQFGKLAQINYFDGKNKQYGYIKFTYSSNGYVTNMEQKSYDQLTYAAVDRGIENSNLQVTIDYLYNNGQALEYKYWIENGNKTRETGRSSAGGSESGTFQYDNYINPYYVLGVQDIYLRYNSRNNMIHQDKGYSGGFPTSEPYEFTYSYNEAGYPVQLLKKFRTYSTGMHQYTAKTVYTYKN